MSTESEKKGIEASFKSMDTEESGYLFQSSHRICMGAIV